MKTRILLAALAFGCLFFSACSVNKMAVNALSDALSSEGSAAVFSGDSDPQLVGDALPFAIKMYETLLDANPGHLGLMFTTGSLFIMYANAYVQGPAEMLPSEDWQTREASLNRAKQLYLRGNALLYKALDKKYPGFTAATANETLETFLKKCKKEDVGMLYWAVAGGMAAYSINITDFELGSHLSEWKTMIMRAYELNPNYGTAMLDEFLILFYASMPEILGGDKEKALFHFQLALEKTSGNSANAYVSYAQSICIPNQDYETFKDCLEKALAINPDADPPNRLLTIVTQQKARWLLDTAYTYFLHLPFPGNY